MRQWLGNQWQKISTWYGHQLERPRALLTTLLITCLASIGLLSQTAINGDPISLLPTSDPAVQAYRSQQTELGATNILRISVDVEQPALGPPLVDSIAGMIRAIPDVAAVYAQAPLGYFQRHALLYLPYDQLDAFASTVERRLHELSFADWITDLHVPEPPLSIVPLLEQYTFARMTPYYQTDDGLHYIIMVRMTKPPGESSFWTLRLIDTIEQIGQYAVNAIPTKPGESAPAQVRVGGSYFQVARQVQQIIRDTLVVTGVGLAGLALFFWMLHRSAWRVLTIMLPLCVGTLWSYAAALALGGINFFTVGTCMLTLGICSSMSIRMLFYFDHHNDDTSLSEQIRTAGAEFFRSMKIPGLVIAATLAFLSFAKLRALSQCGMLAGVSILLHVISLYCCAPLTYVRLTRRPHSNIPIQIQSLIGRATHWLSQTDGFIVVTGCGVTLMLILILRIPVLNADLTHLLFTPESSVLEPSLRRLVEGISHPGVIHATSRADADYFAAALRQAQATDPNAPIYTALSLDDMIPGNQPDKLARIAKLQRAFTPEVLEKLTPADAATYTLLRPALSPAPITTDTLPTEVRTLFQPFQGELGSMAYVIPKVSAERAAELRHYTRVVTQTPCPQCTGPIEVAGEMSVFYSIVEHIVPEQLLGMLGGSTTIFFLMFLSLRNRRHVLICSVPPLATVVLTMSVMSWANLELNMLNVGAMPLIMAFAVNATMLMQQQITRTGKILVTSYIRTASFICSNAIALVVCFTATAFAHNPGLSSFGQLAAFGTTIGVAAALLWFPGFVQIIALLFPLRAPGKTPSKK